MNDETIQPNSFQFYVKSFQSAFEADQAESYRKILDEIYQELRLDKHDSSPTTKSRLLSYLGHEIRELAIESQKITLVRNRLGQKGLLPPKGYQVKFAEEYLQLCEPLGVKRAEVTNTIESPTMFQHFAPQIEGNSEALSLYVRSYLNNLDPYSILVDSRRVGTDITVHYAIRIFHSDIDVTKITEPTDLLRTFTDAFGYAFRIGEREGKLFLYEKINEDSYSLVIPHTEKVPVDVRSSFRKMLNGKLEVSIAYAVNVLSYAESLQKHGVKITRSMSI